MAKGSATLTSAPIQTAGAEGERAEPGSIRCSQDARRASGSWFEHSSIQP